MATKHLLNERKYIKVSVKQKRRKRGLRNASLPNNSIVNVNVCLLNVIFCMYVHTPMSQPGMDTTNFARLTTDVSIYFGSTSVLCNNTISCLLICDIIFQPYVFPIRAPAPFGSFSITLASPATGGMLANQQAQCRTYINRNQSALEKYNIVN